MSRFDRDGAVALNKAYGDMLSSCRNLLVRKCAIPLKPLGTTVWFAVSVADTDNRDWFCGVAVNVRAAVCTPDTLLQSTDRKTLCSGLLGEIDPFDGEMFTHEALLVTVKVKGVGPPAPTSMKRSPVGTNGSIVRAGLPQP